jgi:hypothetical protein
MLTFITRGCLLVGVLAQSLLVRNETLIFLHIPKAAGTSLVAVLDRQFPPESIYPVGNQAAEDLAALPEEQRRQIKLLHGHMYFGLHGVLPQPCSYITLLRDPVERVASLYQYIQGRPRHYLYDRVVKQGMTLADLLQGKNRAFDEFRDGQVRLLNDHAFANAHRDEPEVLFRAAQENLAAHFTLVGLVEQFDETLLLLRRQFGWGLPLYIKRNVTRRRPARETLDAQTLAIIQAHNQRDQLLYQSVTDGFEQLVQAQGIRSEVGRFRLLNRLYGGVYRIRHKVFGKG